MLYEQQKEWIGSGDPEEIIANLTTLGKKAGMSEDQIDACLKDEAMATRLVATFQTHAEADEINSTPTLVIDGEKYSNMSYDALAEILDEKLGDS
jgi:protein-disulfide isomerase